ncbi:RraA family protein [Streptomyces sp. NPDC005820]|uniref:RraA family protein n=1 Tax=Streptomyces sp. NPDC005820 TaxID=3157069 RepID=UPI0033ECCD66
MPSSDRAERPETSEITVGSASLYEAAGKVGALPAVIRSIHPGMRVIGPALPVRSPAGDNLWLHRAIYAAERGDVLVVDTGSGLEHGYWGEVMTAAAQHRGIAGLVITGGVRDSAELIARGFPTFAGAVSVRGTTKNPQGDGDVGSAVRIGDVVVRRGDLVLADDDGVVVLPAADAAKALAEAERRDSAEADIMTRLSAGETTIDIYGLPTEHTG